MYSFIHWALDAIKIALDVFIQLMSLLYVFSELTRLFFLTFFIRISNGKPNLYESDSFMLLEMDFLHLPIIQYISSLNSEMDSFLLFS